MKNNIELSLLRAIHNFFMLMNRLYRYYLNVKDHVGTNMCIVVIAASNAFISLEMNDSELQFRFMAIHLVILSLLYMVGFKLDHDNNEKGAHDLAITIFTALFLPSILIHAYSFILDLI